MRLSAVILLLAALAVASAAILHSAPPHKKLPKHYIVILHSNLTKVERDEHVAALSRTGEATVKHLYNIGTLIGFSARLSESALRAQLEHPDVKYVEEDQVVTLNVEAPAAIVDQPNAEWGLARTCQRNLTSDYTYKYDERAGGGVDVYVIDTGIYTNHSEFEGRATMEYNAITGEAADDLNGHGTHCAGTIGGITYGIAKQVLLKGVKVLAGSGSGTIAGVIAGVNYVTNNKIPGRPTVGSMSLGGGASPTLDSAVDGCVKSGVFMIVAAGNSNDDACYYSPARVPSAITVGAIGITNLRAYYSNYGTCVDIFAPGTNVKSAWIGNPTAVNTISGTSMATPHVAGTMAIQLSRDVKYSAADLTADATTGQVLTPGAGSPNLLLYSKYEA